VVRVALSGKIRKRGNVFFIPADDPDLAEYLVADYSLEVGDTFFVNRGTFPAVVREIRAIECFGDTVRFIDFGLQVNGGLIEGYGFSATGILAGCPGFAQVVDYLYCSIACLPAWCLFAFRQKNTNKGTGSTSCKGPRHTIDGPRFTAYGLRCETAVNLLKKADKFLVLPFTTSQLKKTT
jgi:hypothetical protein